MRNSANDFECRVILRHGLPVIVNPRRRNIGMRQPLRAGYRIAYDKEGVIMCERGRHLSDR